MGSQAEKLDHKGMMYGPYAAMAAQAKGEATFTAKEAEPSKEAEEPSLGDLNPLIHYPNLARREAIDALRVVSLDKITKYGGVAPERIESTLVTSMFPNVAPQLRFITRFEVGTGELDEDKMALLEELVKQTYRVKVRTRTGSEGKEIPTEIYPPANANSAFRSKTGGWYMGPNLTPTDSLHTGLFVFKDLGEVNKDNFFEAEAVERKYIVEIREAAMYQTDLVEFVTQVSSILGKGRLLDHGDLLYEVYYDLMRLGLKNVDNHVIYGMDEAIARIKRGLLLPLANPELSQGVNQHPESVLMVGYPGTGKTLAVEQLLREETGVFVLPIDPLDLIKELQTDKEKQTLLPRIAEVSRSTGRRVILHIDDIENMVKNEELTHSTMLNLMAGIKENGFYVLASTNDPEKIDPALLQPQRFGILIYCGLQGEEARREILRLHTNEQSRRLGMPLFDSEEAREMILDEVTVHTDYYTPRYIAEIANVAKSFLLARIAQESGKSVGLTEADLQGHTFNIEDWENAFLEVSSRYDKDRVKRRDEELKEFVRKHVARGPMGIPFPQHDSVKNTRPFSRDIYERIAALKSDS